jgi:hypothetical protein
VGPGEGFAPSRPPPPGGRATWTAFGLKIIGIDRVLMLGVWILVRDYECLSVLIGQFSKFIYNFEWSYILYFLDI